MATPTYDTAAGGTSAFSTSLNFSIAPAANSDRCLLCFVWCYGDSSGTIGDSAVTYNSVGMTALEAQANDPTYNYPYRAFKLLGDGNIATGSHTVAVTVTANTGSLHLMAFCVSYYNVSSTGDVYSVGHAGANSQNASWTVSPSSGDLSVVLAIGDNTAHSWTAGTGDTLQLSSSILYSGFRATVLDGVDQSTVSATISGSGDGWWGTRMALSKTSPTTVTGDLSQTFGTFSLTPVGNIIITGSLS